MPAIAIPAIIGAAGTLGASAIQAHAAGSARKSQEAAGAKANARLDPYATAGYGAVSNLQGMVGRPAPSAPSSTGASGDPMAAIYANPSLAFNGPLPPGVTRSPGSIMGALHGASSAYGPSSLAGMAAGGGGGQQQMITVRAPTGETQSVPASQSGYWQSKGATVIG